MGREAGETIIVNEGKGLSVASPTEDSLRKQT